MNKKSTIVQVDDEEIEIIAPRIKSDKIFRQVVGEVFKNSVGDLPLAGGWGYDKDDAIIIDSNDAILDADEVIDVVSVEYMLTRPRAFLELKTFNTTDIVYSRVQSTVVAQKMVSIDDKKFDVLTCVNNATRQNKNKKDKIWYKSEFWFDISDFFNK